LKIYITFTLQNKANLRVCMHSLESQSYHCIKWPIGILPKTSISNYLWQPNWRNALFWL